MGYYVTIESISKDYKRMWDYICKKILNHTKTVAVTRKLDKLCDSKFVKINMKKKLITQQR